MIKKQVCFFGMLFLVLASQATELDFDSFKLRISEWGGAFSVSMEKQKLIDGMLFFDVKTDKKTDSRFFQNSTMVKDKVSATCSRDGKNVIIALSGTMKSKALQMSAPYTQSISVQPDGTLNFDYTLNLPEGTKLKDTPRLLLSLPMSAVAGKGIWYKTATKEEWKVIDKKHIKGRNLRGNNLNLLKIATNLGPIELIPKNGLLNFHDTRFYQKNGGIRADISGQFKEGQWRVYFAIKLPVESIKLPEQIAQKEIENFKPDFKDWDIYLPHLKRKHLSGWWKLNMLPGTKGNPANDAGTKGKFYSLECDDSKWDKAMVPTDWHKPFMKKGNKIKRSHREFGGVGWYRTIFNAPENSGGERAILHFDEVVRKADVYLNGRKVGSHVNHRLEGMHTTREDFEIDVTDAIQFGKANVLAVRVYHSGKPVSWGWASRGGILGRVYLDLRPATWCEEIMITPEDNLKDISFDCLLDGSKNASCSNEWKAEVFEWKSGKTVAESSVKSPFIKDKERWISGKVSISNPSLWSCESPFLYGLRLKNSSGETTGVKRFGMRRFNVKNGNFNLNGKPVALRGLCNGEINFTKRINYIFAQNEGNAMRRHFEALRNANVNHIRFHTSLMPPVAYDIFDELGFLITDEINYPNKKIKNAKVADKISIQGIDYACKKDGSLRPEFAKRVARRIRGLYSHPSVGTFSFGNEMRGEGQCGKMFNNLYSLYTKLDKQNRPITPSSGRFWKSAGNMESLSKIDKLDYIDTHDYTGSINNWPVAYCQPIAENFIKEGKKYYPKNLPPIINGETVYFAPHYYDWFYGEIWETEDDAEPDWDKYIWALTKMGETHPDHKKMSYYWVRNCGTRGYKYHRAEWRGWYTEKILDVQRKLWPDLDGFEILSGRYFSKPTPLFPLAEAKFKPNEGYDSLKQACAPAVVVLDYVAPNRYAGEFIQTNAHVVNNSEEKLQNASLDIRIVRDGEILKEIKIPVGKIAVGEKKTVPFKIELPLKNGAFFLTYKLEDGGSALCERKVDLTLRKRNKVFAPIKTDKKIFLYDAVEKVFTGMGRASTSRLLKTFGVPFKAISNFDNLDKCDLLIVGANSIDEKLRDESDKIRKYIENGGKILVFEQAQMGRLPFAGELEYVLAGPGQFAETVRQFHPVVNGMRQKEFLGWNQKDWSVYRSFISPLSEAVILAGGDSTTWGSDNFGMVAAHAKLGKGTMLLSQAELTPIFDKDAAAGQMARNLLTTALDDSAIKHASKFRGKPVLIKPLRKKDSVYISLIPAANMGFVDKKAADGKGGWSDQGPKNDLRKLPFGEHLMAGIPFEILNPENNNGKSCIVVSSNPKLKFNAVSSPLPINKKLKRLIFLHTGAWMGKQNVAAGKYTVHYASGKTVDIPLISGKQIADWWSAPGQKVTDCQCAWSASNGSSIIGAYAYSWANPYPQDKIESITVESSGAPVIGLLALTGEKL